MRIIKEKSFGVIPFRKINGQIEFLLIKHIAGYWGFPKGHPEKGESEIETARRELKEETGITKVSLMADIDLTDFYKFEYNKKAISKVVRYFLGFAHNSENRIVLNEEATDYVWANHDKALGIIIFRGLKNIINQSHDWLQKNYL